jgi:hypothetical protein
MGQYLWQDRKLRSAWAMPKSLLEKNRREILRFTEFEPDEVAIVDGTPQKVVDALQNPAHKFFLMGFDRYSQVHEILPPDCKALFVDEMHKGWGGDSSKRTQAFYKAMERRNEFFIGMTGSLVNGRLDSAYPAIKAIEPRYYPSFNGFMNFHAIYDDDMKVIGWRNHWKLSAILGKHGIRHTFEEVYGKEDVVIMPEPVYMSERHRAIYDKFEQQAILELEKFYVDGTEPGVGFIRARQLLEHPNMFPDLSEDAKGKWVNILPDERPAKEEYIDLHLTDHVRNGTPVVVFSAMVPQQKRILDMMRHEHKMEVEILNGEVSAKRRGEIDLAVQRGDLQGLVASGEVADVGFNWQYFGKQELCHMIMATINFLDTTFFQAYRRAIRGKREKSLLVSVPQYVDTIEQRIAQIVHRKSVMANKVDANRPIFDLLIGNRTSEDVFA